MIRSKNKRSSAWVVAVSSAHVVSHRCTSYTGELWSLAHFAVVIVSSRQARPLG